MGVFDELAKLASGAVPLAVQGVTAYRGAKQEQTAQNASVMQQLEEMAARRQRQAQQDAMEADFKRSQIAKNEADAYATQHPQEKPTHFQTVTLDDGVYAFDPVKGARGEKIGNRPPSQASEPSWQTIDTAQGPLQVNPKTGQTRTVAGPDGRPLPPRTGVNGMSPTQANQVKAQQQALLNLRRSLAALEDRVRTSGMEIMSGPGKQELGSLLSDAQIQYKEAANLGALTGPDMGMIEKALGDPTSPLQLLRGGAQGSLRGIQATQDMLDRRAKSIKDVYGVDMPPEFYQGRAPQAGTTQRAPSTTAAADVIQKYGLTPRR